MKRNIRAATDPAVTEREKRNASLARKIGAEGVVLLENDGVLPLKTDRVALYGAGARHTAYGGTGSGENRPRYRVSVEEGLKNAGVTVTTGELLDGLEREYAVAYRAWRKRLIKGLKKCRMTARMDYASAHPFLPPLGEIGGAADTDTALYVLSRQAGEGSDRRLGEGDYYIRPEEKERLKALSALYPKTILVLNVGGVIDLSFTKELNLSAIVLASLGGMEAGNALADVLTGKVAPSGRLSATWAESYGDYPSCDTYSYLGDAREQDYFEDIFVGYRWFHAKKIKPRYPFGYGLSYTRFQKECRDITMQNGVVRCGIAVKNIGECAGREVVQLYLSAPHGALIKEKVSLAGFAKTKNLAPDESEEIEVSFDLGDFASYDEKSASFVLEEGDYGIYLGENAEDLTAIGALSLGQRVVTEKCKNVCPVKRDIKFFVPSETERGPFNGKRVKIDSDEIKRVTHGYGNPALPQGETENLSVNDQIKLLVGTSYLGAVHNTVFGAAGYTTSKFVKRGIPNLPMTDGPQGLNVSPKALKPKQNFFNIPVIPEALRYGFLGWLVNRGAPKKRKKKVYYQYATAFPSETLAAQTFDGELLYEMGRAVGEEMEELGVAFFLAPAMNIQRNPLCGRNYEYFSEDPYLTGKLAAAVVRGVQERKGRFATLKHFACNDSETERNLSSSNLGERALREIYLKAFKIAVRESAPRAVMASYNMVNGEYACNSYELLTEILRNEFGFDGVVMTDWFAAGHDQSFTEKCAPAGCDLVMPGLPKDAKRIKRAYRKGEITEAEITLSAGRILRAAIEYGSMEHNRG